jgi:hypothetical protein
MWPTQFMSKALRRISFVIARFPGFGGGSGFANLEAMCTGSDTKVTSPASLTRVTVYLGV